MVRTGAVSRVKALLGGRGLDDTARPVQLWRVASRRSRLCLAVKRGVRTGGHSSQLGWARRSLLTSFPESVTNGAWLPVQGCPTIDDSPV